MPGALTFKSIDVREAKDLQYSFHWLHFNMTGDVICQMSTIPPGRNSSGNEDCRDIKLSDSQFLADVASEWVKSKVKKQWTEPFDCARHYYCLIVREFRRWVNILFCRAQIHHWQNNQESISSGLKKSTVVFLMSILRNNFPTGIIKSENYHSWLLSYFAWLQMSLS